MRRFRSLSYFFIFALLFSSDKILAAAYQFYELGTPIIGTAGVGQAAVANDASTAYFNPAGMARLPGAEFMLGSQLILPTIYFHKNELNTFSGGDGGNAGYLLPGLGIYDVMTVPRVPKLKLGIALTSPYGGFLYYNNGWVGRYFVQDTQLLTMNLNPTFSYQFAPHGAIGAGFILEYASLHQSSAIPLSRDADGQINVKVEDISPGFNVGLLFTPTDNTRFGIAYRSGIRHNMRGRTVFYRLDTSPGTTSQIIMPQNVISSLKLALTEKFSVLGEVGWANWSAMQNVSLVVDNISLVTKLNWVNTYRVGLGAQYNLNPALLIQLGASYDSSPTVSTLRVPELPMDRQVRIGTGLILSANQAIQLAFSYEYIDFGKASINRVTRIGTLAGSYLRNFANVLQVSINIAL